MAFNQPWLRTTPELDYASTASNGEQGEDLPPSPSTPGAQSVGLAASIDDTAVLSFSGSHYNGYEQRSSDDILPDDLEFDPEATCALYAEIGFEGQQAVGGACFQYSPERLEFGQIHGQSATAQGFHLLESEPLTSLSHRPLLQPIGSGPVNERLYIPPCFSDPTAELQCFHCGRDPTIIQMDSGPPIPPRATLSRQPTANATHTPPPPSPSKLPISPAPTAPQKPPLRAATCDWCGRTFTRSGGLPRHKSTACPKRPVDVLGSLFACQMCGATHSRKDKMQRHCQRTHGAALGRERFVEKR